MSKWLAVDFRPTPPEVIPDRDFEDSIWLNAFRKGQFGHMWTLLVETDNLFVFEYNGSLHVSGLYIMVRTA